MILSPPLTKLQTAMGLLAIFALLLVATVMLFVLARMVDVPFEWVVLPVLLAALGALLAALLAKQKRGRRLMEQNQEALTLVNQADLMGAARLLDGMIAESSRFRTLRAVFVLNRSVVLMLAGNPEQALKLARPILDGGWHRHGLEPHAGAVVNAVAMPLVLLSRLDEAEAILNANVPGMKAEQRVSTLAARALLAARRERWDEALRLVSAEAAAAEGVMPARNLRLLATLARFAEDRSGRPAPTLHWPLTDTADLGYLADHWPAFAVWLHARSANAPTISSP